MDAGHLGARFSLQWSRHSMASAGELPGPKIVILYSTTGGGHRSVAEALREAAEDLIGNVQVVCLDLLLDGTVFPLNRAESLYHTLVERAPRLWRATWQIGEQRWLLHAMLRLGAVLARPARKLWTTLNPDLVISVHPLLNHVPLRQLRAQGRSTPCITVVTDWTSVSWAWLNPDVDHLFLATDIGLDRARSSGIDSDRVHLSGLPVSRRFQHVEQDEKPQHRSSLHLPPDQPVVLLVCGSGRSQQCAETARSVAWDLAAINMGQLVVICSDNAPLQRQLQACAWPAPTTIVGFAGNMEAWMAASDLIICKAGPSTIAEALVVGLPLVLYDFIPGQEEGNVQLAVDSGAAVTRASPSEIGTAVAELLQPGSPLLAEMAVKATELSRPSAAMDTMRAMIRLLPDTGSR